MIDFVPSFRSVDLGSVLKVQSRFFVMVISNNVNGDGFLYDAWSFKSNHRTTGAFIFLAFY